MSGDGKAELGEVVAQMVEDLRAGGEDMQAEGEMSEDLRVVVERVAVGPSRKCLGVEGLLMTQMQRGSEAAGAGLEDDSCLARAAG